MPASPTRSAGRRRATNSPAPAHLDTPAPAPAERDSLVSPADDPARRATLVADRGDLSHVADLLCAHRDVVLRRWLEVTCRQPFHDCEHQQHVADHIPPLYDALVGLLTRAAPR